MKETVQIDRMQEPLRSEEKEELVGYIGFNQLRLPCHHNQKSIGEVKWKMKNNPGEMENMPLRSSLLKLS